MIKHSSGSVGAKGAMPPPLGPVKIGHKKDGPPLPGKDHFFDWTECSADSMNVQSVYVRFNTWRADELKTINPRS